MLSMLRALWRRSRSLPVMGSLLAAADRLWWARTIRRAHVVDLEFLRARHPGRRIGVRRAVRAYVRGGYRTGLVLNPLFLEGLVSAQLPDSDRVPALYAYLVSDPERIETTVAWSAPDHAGRYPDALRAPGGPLGHAWRMLAAGASLSMRSGSRLDRSAVRLIATDVLRRSSAPEAPRRSDSSAEVPDTFLEIGLGPGDRDGRILTVLLAFLERFGGSRTRAVLEVDLAPPEVRVAARLLALADDRVQLLDDSTVQHEGGTVLLRREPGADIEAPGLAALRDAAQVGPVEPLLLADDGTVASAGVVTHGGQGFPLLASFPAEDARALGESVPSAAFHAPVSARRAGDAAPPRVLLGVDAIMTQPVPRRPLPLPGLIDSPAPALARSLAFGTWTLQGPSILRTSGVFDLPDGTSVPRLRWAIKTAAPAGPRGESWGDTHFARALAAALERIGQYAAVDARPAAQRTTARFDDVTVVLRGPHPIAPPPTGRRMLWIISHPDEITSDELSGFDRVYAASRPWARDASLRFDRPVEALLQCTDPTRFHPTGASRDGSLVFVGTARGLHRPAVVAPISAGMPLKVYGPDWRGYIPASHIIATGIANEDLPSRYETAGVVLNDHWPAMRKHGFISNRPYDVLAAGGRVISDEVEGIAQEFEGAVPTFRNGDDLVALLSGDPDALFPDGEQMARIGALVRERDSFDARARTLLNDALSER
ncbi:MAG: glycosyltransferase [Microbacterium sp.]|uniref:glycosyltransferase n=1 Tax=Microbacterium sp. TaxID=51671 RepID=UPI00282B3E0C|nr:glycosyltransferase [Microbacterium sp.]MDR2323361.1 glycosyltransferase [Microbacterium sp.]